MSLHRVSNQIKEIERLLNSVLLPRLEVQRLLWIPRIGRQAAYTIYLEVGDIQRFISPSLRRPSSRSACLTQFRIAPSEGSNSRANSPGVLPDRTNSTICRRDSGGYGSCALGIVDSSRLCWRGLAA
jgi:hypothetical protein